MSKIIFNRTCECEVIVKDNALGELAQSLDVKKGSKVAILASINVSESILNELISSIENQGYSCFSYRLRDGENAKVFERVEYITAFLQFNNFTRSDVLINLGGGTLCDLGAFVASLYMRGIKYVNVPTTLLCAVDACVGGKTAIDVNGGKNLLGTFYQPHKVFVDVNLLNDLPDAIFNDGISEIVKYAIIDDNFGNYLKKLGNLNAIRQNLNEIITKCLNIKARIVAEDELDYSKRRVLNAGHTVAHALECLSNFTLSHAKAVALGLKIESDLSLKLGLITSERHQFICWLLKTFASETQFSYNVSELISAMQKDKKNFDNKIAFILASKHSVTEYSLTSDQLINLL